MDLKELESALLKGRKISRDQLLSAVPRGQWDDLDRIMEITHSLQQCGFAFLVSHLYVPQDVALRMIAGRIPRYLTETGILNSHYYKHLRGAYQRREANGV